MALARTAPQMVWQPPVCECAQFLNRAEVLVCALGYMWAVPRGIIYSSKVQTCSNQFAGDVQQDSSGQP